MICLLSGGSEFTNNLIFNACRETGDHGPINSWDRQPFVTEIATGEPSWNAAITTVSQNLIWANYGSSQGFDTDDGSSWYNISNNFMYQADGYKMDFGGHDTMVNDNMFYKFKGDGQNCINTWPYVYNHGTTYSGNKCMLPESHNIGSVNGCDCPGDGGGSHRPSDEQCGVSFSDNEYYGFKANLTVSCHGGSDYSIPFSDWQVIAHE
jgi:hypothetical protein